MVRAQDVAWRLIRLADEERTGERMTQLRLQKLLYYCQGWYLAWYGDPLFAERIEAWKHGPVVPEVWRSLGAQGREPLSLPSETTALPEQATAAIDQVWSHYRKYSAFGLMELAHREAPWRTHFHPDADGRGDEIIPESDMATYFRQEFTRQTGETGETTNTTVAQPRIGHDCLLQELGW